VQLATMLILRFSKLIIALLRALAFSLSARFVNALIATEPVSSFLLFFSTRGKAGKIGPRGNFEFCPRSNVEFI